MKMTQIKVRNMQSSKGNDVPNQFIIEDWQSAPQIKVFQSYRSIIARVEIYDYDTKQVYLDEKYWDYSTTTGKYRNQFLGEGIAETRKKIASGEYKLADLNA